MKKIIFPILIILTILTGCIKPNNILDPVDAFNLVQENKDNSDFIILDVRTEEEFREGHMDGAINIDYYNKNFKENLDQLDKTKTYLVYCASGKRSGNTINIMKELGFNILYDLKGGMANYQQQGFMLVS